MKFMKIGGCPNFYFYFKKGVPCNIALTRFVKFRWNSIDFMFFEHTTMQFLEKQKSVKPLKSLAHQFSGWPCYKKVRWFLRDFHFFRFTGDWGRNFEWFSQDCATVFEKTLENASECLACNWSRYQLWTSIFKSCTTTGTL